MSTATALPKSKRIVNYMGQNSPDGDPFWQGPLTPAQRRRIRHKENRADAHQVIGAGYPSKRKRRIPIKPRLMYGGYGISQVPPKVYGDGDK
jgi:hypothetical protein